MIIIEFFGPPCCGKTFYANYLVKRNRKIIISSNTLILDYSHKFLKLSLLEKISLKYMRLIKFLKKIKSMEKKNTITFQNNNSVDSSFSNNIFTNIFTNIFFASYKNVCKKIFVLYKKKNLKFIKFYLDQLKLINDKDKRKIYKHWMEENAAKYFIAKSIKEKFIIIFDEGFIQRSSFLINKSTFPKNKINKYLRLMNKPDYVVYVDRNSNILMKRSKYRQLGKKNDFQYNHTNQIKKYQLFFKNVFKNVNQLYS